jgi:hypothetical protein
MVRAGLGLRQLPASHSVTDRGHVPELAQISAQLVEPVAGTGHEVVGDGRAVRAGGEVGDVAVSARPGPGRSCGAGVGWTGMLVLGISPAEAFGCLGPERVAAYRGVTVQRFLSGVVRGRERGMAQRQRSAAVAAGLARFDMVVT